ncbi:Lipoprotein [Plantibacter sp. RU18]
MFISTNGPRMSASRVKLAAALCAIPLLIGSLAACSTPDEPSSSGKEMSFNDYQLAFAQCMRDEGIDMEDPTGEGQEGLKFGSEDDEAQEAALKKCTDKLGTPPAPPGGEQSDAEAHEEQLKLAECLRENGVDVPDPKEGEGLRLPADAPEEAFAACGIEGGSGSVVRQG